MVSEDEHVKKDISTKELALRLHIPIEEARALNALPEPAADLSSRTRGVPILDEDPAAWYCRKRTDGLQYMLEVNNQRYCMLQRTCLCQVQNGAKAKKCVYKGR